MNSKTEHADIDSIRDIHAAIAAQVRAQRMGDTVEHRVSARNLLASSVEMVSQVTIDENVSLANFLRWF